MRGSIQNSNGHTLASWQVLACCSCWPVAPAALSIDLTPKTESILLRCGARFGVMTAHPSRSLQRAAVRHTAAKSPLDVARSGHLDRGAFIHL